MTPEEIVEAIKRGILALNEPSYGGYEIEEFHAEERARNIATWMIGQIDEANDASGDTVRGSDLPYRATEKTPKLDPIEWPHEKQHENGKH